MWVIICYNQIDKSEFAEAKEIMWLVFAILSAVFAALTSILAKVGIEGVDSNLATAVRTVVVVAMEKAGYF